MREGRRVIAGFFVKEISSSFFSKKIIKNWALLENNMIFFVKCKMNWLRDACGMRHDYCDLSHWCEWWDVWALSMRSEANKLLIFIWRRMAFGESLVFHFQSINVGWGNRDAITNGWCDIEWVKIVCVCVCGRAHSIFESLKRYICKWMEAQLHE